MAKRSTTGPAEEFVFCPLGGVGEIGMNFSLYGFGSPAKKDWIAVDCGVAFAGPDLPGIDLVMPDPGFIARENKRLRALIITHAHEDHIGAVADLWPRLGCPVYLTPFAAAMLEAKKLNEPGAPKMPIHIIGPGQVIEVGPFSFEMIAVAHSIPESTSLAIRSPLGLVVHTGDWKIDPTPVLGDKTDEARFRALGDEGVLAMIGDSTNAIRDGVSPSEREVAAELEQIIRGAKGRVAVTTFASNAARVRSVAEAAMRCDRQVVLVGRAMERVMSIAREQGMLDGIPPFVSVESYGYLPRDKVVAVLTGSQGEPRAALARIANDDHPEVTLTPGDTVIFSSRTIPGNEKAVGGIINALVKQGVKIITDRDALVHVSGHPRRGEMEQMYNWVRPQIAIPVHGEPYHMAEHAALARRMGVKEVLLANDGDVIRLAPGEPDVVDTVTAQRLFKDGTILEEEAARTVPERRRLAFAGIVSVAIAMDERGQVVGDIQLDMAGVPEKDAMGDDLGELVEETVIDCVEGLPKARRRDPDAVAESVTRAIRGTLNGRWGKKPTCHVLVVTV
ncbi:ribonuclease J [Phreatobacter oligotrophus]|uniref:Ribonuclease J n=1 Tax=Phreatobacter oligotrophus TaxID=1122261 RepID=A0A2T4Z646_9HYPH|nr:ribonuclease J [Phreatobacter oligotrophus]PTM57360.1 ribonuclease J [Phreatobacter oligotrophus]